LLFLFAKWQQLPKSATSLSSNGQTRVKVTMSRYDLDLWPLSSLRMSVMRVVVLHPYTWCEVRRPSRSEDTTDFRSRR